MDPSPLPDPALVVLVGASGSGKSTWASARYLPTEVVSSDALRAVVGSGPHDLAASADAFAVLDTVVSARVGRGLTTVVDTLGLDAGRRQAWRALAAQHGMPAVTVRFDTPAGTCRERNRTRPVPVPAAALTAQLRQVPGVAEALVREGWDLVHVVVTPPATPPTPTTTPTPRPEQTGRDQQAAQQAAQEAVGPAAGQAVRSAAAAGPAAAGQAAGERTGPLAPAARRPDLVLQLSRFPWGQDPTGWLVAVARAAQDAGLAGVALMDHLIQIPQVGRDWEDLPEPYVALGLLAGAVPGLELGALVSPLSVRSPGLLAKTLATLDVLCGGRAFCGVGAGWWEREHAAYGVAFPPAGERVDAVAAGIETMRALWRKGTGAYVGERVHLPETTSYPRPVGRLPVIVGGRGARLLEVAARLADGVNLPSQVALLDEGTDRLRASCAAVGRDPTEVAVTVLDVPVVGTDRADTAGRVERLRGRRPAAAYARTHHAGLAQEHAERYLMLGERGVSRVFVALPDLQEPADLDRLAPVVAALR